MDHTTRALLATVLACGLSRTAHAQSKPARDLASATLEDLMNIEITSVSRKEDRATDAPAAVFVISQNDIQRSGMTTVPDLLRLAPGVDVAQINSNKWAVSVRGFNGLFANKVLVLVDGRSVYNRLFSGVLWDAQDVMIDDIDRIEVIRGPGAAIWGANAVNGVINIVTKGAADTQGTLVRIDGGRSGAQGAVRYGGTLGTASYRLYSQWTARNESISSAGTDAGDPSHNTTVGLRADWTTQPGVLMVEGQFTAGQAHALWPNLATPTAASTPIATDASDERGGYLVARWTHTRPGGGSLQVQSFADVSGRQEPVGDYRRRAVDVDTQYHTSVGPHQDLVGGVGYRFIDETFTGHVGFALTPAQSDLSLLTAFLQDEVTLFAKRLVLTLGSQVQYDSDSGAGVQPTARVLWKGLSRQRLWAATSRALRTPSLQDRGLRLAYPAVPTASGLPLTAIVVGNPAAETERFIDAEAGYRLEFGTTASIDATGFVGRYDRLQTQEVGAPVVQFVPSPQISVTTQFGNLLNAETRGLEVAGHWVPVSDWRFDASYSAFHLTPRPSAASQDPTATGQDGSSPGSQWQLRAEFKPATRAAVNAAIYHVGRLEQVQVAAYTRADLSAEWRFTNQLSVKAIGQHLLAHSHAEFGGVNSLLLATEVPRSVSLRLRWAFR
jgi:iron complex outermembrane receptor protein